MSNLVQHAIREIELLKKSLPDPDNRPIIEPFIPELVALIAAVAERSGASGGSMPFIAGVTAGTIKKLLMFEPITPITGEDHEWVDVTDQAGSQKGKLYQNNRCSALFKDDTGAYYLDAVTFKTQAGSGWHSNNVHLSNGTKIGSRQYVKSFPFTPKNFTVVVNEIEVAKDDWEFTLEDGSQLIAVYEYYNPGPTEYSDAEDLAMIAAARAGTPMERPSTIARRQQLEAEGKTQAAAPLQPIQTPQTKKDIGPKNPPKPKGDHPVA